MDMKRREVKIKYKGTVRDNFLSIENMKTQDRHLPC